MNSVADWLRRLEKNRGIELGLARVSRVLRRLGVRTERPVIVVGGTNGKGSVCALMDAILAASGQLTGCYLSPHLLRFNERIRIGGVEVDDTRLLAAFSAVEQARRGANETLTYFEFVTLTALYLFSETRCNCWILEVGLGGRLDAVNVMDATVAVVTNVGIDHMEYLGATREAIAGEKAGIFRRGKAAVIGDDKPPKTLLQAAKETGAKVRLLNRDFLAAANGDGWSYRGRRNFCTLPPPALRGRHQLANAACAIAALESLPAEYWPGVGAIRKGLHQMALPARGQLLPGPPTVVLDVAHNTAAAKILERQLFDMGFFPRTRAIFGALSNKEVTAMTRALAQRVDKWYVAQPAGGDLSAADTAAAVAAGGGSATVYDSVAAAAAAASADSGENDRIVVTGSFLTVADFLRYKNNE